MMYSLIFNFMVLIRMIVELVLHCVVNSLSLPLTEGFRIFGNDSKCYRQQAQLILMNKFARNGLHIAEELLSKIVIFPIVGTIVKPPALKPRIAVSAGAVHTYLLRAWA
ncbi:hypothetical protein ACFX13_009507 [Malus domestica]